MTDQATIDPKSSTLKYNGRVMEMEDEESDRHDEVLVRVVLRQKDPGSPRKFLLPVVDKRDAEALLEGINVDDYVEMECHVLESSDRDVIVVIDEIKAVDSIDEYKGSFTVTGDVTKRKKTPLEAKKGYPSSHMFDLKVAGIDLKVFDRIAREEMKEIKVGDWVTARGYVKCYVDEETLRSVLYVESIESVPRPADS